MEWNALDRFIAGLRFSKAVSAVRTSNSRVVVDIGCGTEGKFLRHIQPHIDAGYGFDRKIPPEGIRIGKITLQSLADIGDGIPLDEAVADCVVMLAVLEHLNQPREALVECCRILKPGGQLVLTVPTWRAKPVLEFLAFRLHVISAEEIRDHKRYYNRSELTVLAAEVFGEKALIRVTSFELGCNLCAVIKKGE